MGTCLSKRGSFTAQHAVNGVTMYKAETEAQVKLKRGNSKKRVEEKNESIAQKNEKGHLRKEIFIIKHRKEDIHGDECAQQQGGDAIVETKGVLGMRASNCTKEEMDAILIQCGRLSRNNSAGKQQKYSSDSKRGFDFEHCENDTISNDEEQNKTNYSSGFCEGDEIVCAEKHHQHRPRHRESPLLYKGSSRRRTPSREREQCCSSSRERRVSRSPGKRSSETNIPANASNNNSNINASSRPERMVSVPATISYKSNGVGAGGGGEFATTTSVKRITVRRNVGAPSPRSQSPARTNENAANGNQVSSAENQQQQFSLSRNSSRKAEQSPHRRNTLSEIDPNTLAYTHSTANINSSKVQIKPKKEIETQANQKPNVDINDNSKNSTNSRVEMDTMTVVPPEVNSLKPQTLTRTRSTRQSRDFDHNPEAPPQSYTSMLLQDIQNFHQKNNTPSVPLPACLTKACSILEAVADLNSTTSSKNRLTYQSSRNNYNVLLGSNQYMKRVIDTKDPFIESEVVVSDDVMEPSLQKYVTFERSGSLGGVDTMEDQESSGSNSFTASSGQQRHRRSISSSREPNSFDSKDCWTSRMNYSRERGSEKSTRLGREGVMMKP
ncbi:hypothetical protein TanjilG_01478 [Lupinus angustifolius]|uniref:Uncharacterized protein n=1 Tax=Lupinus angustifolius TaxID=3871 RepID=A0A4P1QVB2_LUPAN|nr:hypothetical protein TanjilG_01478 [Lupinus angustifolius]